MKVTYKLLKTVALLPVRLLKAMWRGYCFLSVTNIGTPRSAAQRSSLFKLDDYSDMRADRELKRRPFNHHGDNTMFENDHY